MGVTPEGMTTKKPASDRMTCGLKYGILADPVNILDKILIVCEAGGGA